MSLTAGDKLGPYEITGLLGKGGMGEVFRATDTRLHREVAIKVSDETFSDRFDREARAIAALNHPNICHLYDVGPNYLVMELVEGETLADRIKQGAMPLDDALKVARQIADALEAAHEKGITHRDLKPGNVIIRHDGVVKVLDFGLAKMAAPAAASSISPDNSPTLTMEAATQLGVILGTAGYMAPEQALGKRIDKRADIWAFGVVLHEMITGERLFRGETIAETLAALLKESPNLERVPVKVRRLLTRCLEKNPQQRLRDISVVWELLDTEPAVQPPQPIPGKPWLAAACALFALTTAASTFLWLRAPVPDVRSTQFHIDAPEGTEFTPNVGWAPVSPDGRYVILAAGDPAAGRDSYQFWIRPLDSLNARPLQGTEGASRAFWSPDSKSVAFFAAGKLKRSDITGGAPQTLCDAPTVRTRSSGAWNRDGTILFTNSEGIFRVAATGGVPQLILKDSGATHVQFLPDGKRFLYHGEGAKPGIYSASLDNPDARVMILATDTQASYVPAREGKNGYLLWPREQTLFAQSFDPSALRLEGDAIPIAEDLVRLRATAAFWISDAGVLCYRTGESSGGAARLIWLGRDGKRLGEAAKQDLYLGFRLSPDGSRLALAKADASRNNDIWALEFGRGILTRLTFDPSFEGAPLWSPDGRQIVYQSTRDGVSRLYKKDAGGGGKEEPLTSSPEQLTLGDWSRDGRFLTYARYAAATRPDIWALPMEGDRKPFPVLQTPFTTRGAKFSPDGKWIAYESDESGQFEIYVRAFPAASGQWQVSNQGGQNQFWRGDGKELYYLPPGRDKVMAVGITVEAGSIKAETPRELFSVSSPIQSGGANFGVTADGQRFLIRESVERARVSPPLTVVTNWQELLKKR